MNEALYKLQSAETLEIALHQMYSAKKALKLTTKQAKIILEARQNKKSKIFIGIMNYTQLTSAGTYSTLNILNAIRHNQSELFNAIKDTETVEPYPIKGHKIKLLNDLKTIQDTFPRSLNCLYYEMDLFKLTTKQKKIVVSAKKGKGKEGNLIFSKLRNLTKLNKLGTCSPFQILEVILKNQIELILLISGEPVSTYEEDKKKLPLDTNYKYPTKTSKSIWTVKKK